MYETLKALSIRLDSPAQSLTKDAIVQLLIKIVYNSENPLSKNQILNEYKKIVKCDDANRTEIVSILDSLKDTELRYRQGHYYLSATKRKAIDKTKDNSERRFQYIIDSYCKPFFSMEEDVKEWLQDALITFFTNYSKEWISDLCYNQNSVLQSIDQVIEQIERRTLNNNAIVCEDRKSLLISLKKILYSKDPEVESMLWEYGTSQFASQLIKNGNNIDKLTVETFSNAVCLLDTNILIHLALDGTDYSKHLNSIEHIFQALGITVKYLHITKEEYQNTIGYKSDKIIKLFDSYEADVIEEADNQLIHSAKYLGCKTKGDYERFFKQISTVPSVIDKSVMVSLLDDSYELNEVITKAQSDESKLNELNAAYRSFAHKDKKTHALLHDVGLIAGIGYLRKNSKYFILTQDYSIINYAKQYPFLNGLPIAIKIETLLNVLAVNSFQNSCENYVPLFASIIRKGLQPNTRTFKIEDLYYILDKDLHISQLPKQSVIEIVNDVNRRRLLGEDNETICKELTRKVQGEKLKLRDDYDKTREQLSLTQSQKEQAIENHKKGKTELKKKWREEKNKEINKKIKSLQYKLVWIPLCILILTAILLFVNKYCFDSDNIPLYAKVILAILLDIAISLWSILKNVLPKINKLKSEREQVIENYVNDKLNQIYG